MKWKQRIPRSLNQKENWNTREWKWLGDLGQLTGRKRAILVTKQNTFRILHQVLLRFAVYQATYAQNKSSYCQRKITLQGKDDQFQAVRQGGVIQTSSSRGGKSSCLGEILNAVYRKITPCSCGVVELSFSWGERYLYSTLKSLMSCLRESKLI